MINEFFEEWKDVPTWNGVFRISNYGRVYNTITKHYIIGSKTDRDHISVCLCYKNRQKSYRLHRLVATVFQRPLLQTEDAHHKNGFKFCNCNFNIQIIDHKEHIEKYHNTKSDVIRKKMSQKKIKYYNEHPEAKRKHDPVTGRFIKQERGG